MLKRMVPHPLPIFTRQIVCVPKHKPPEQKDLDKLRKFLHEHEKLLVLTGAGISTESGKLQNQMYFMFVGTKIIYLSIWF